MLVTTTYGMCHNSYMTACAHCDKPVRAHGLCNAHYKKLLKYGDPLAGKTNMRGYPTISQYLAKVDKRGPDECWPWTAYCDENNYGYFNSGRSADGKQMSGPAHRYGFEQFIRPLKPGETVDHLCHNRDPECPGGKTCEHRPCQNPAHWEAVTFLTNKTRAFSTRSEEIIRQRIAVTTATKRLRTRCKWGHELTPANSYGYHGRRQCKTCARLAARGQHPRQLAAAESLL